MPKIIIDDGCCSQALAEMRKAEDGLKQALNSLDACLRQAQENYIKNQQIIDTNYRNIPPYSPGGIYGGGRNRPTGPQPDVWEGIKGAIGWALDTDANWLKYQADLLACNVSGRAGIAAATVLLETAKLNYNLCRLLFCGGTFPTIDPDNGGSPGPAGQTPTLPQY